MVDYFEWAERNLAAVTPHELQSREVNVYFSPNVPDERRVVNLADGTLKVFHAGQDRPHRAYFADLESLLEYCRKRSIPLQETDGQIRVVPRGTAEAGDPGKQGQPPRQVA